MFMLKTVLGKIDQILSWSGLTYFKKEIVIPDVDRSSARYYYFVGCEQTFYLFDISPFKFRKLLCTKKVFRKILHHHHKTLLRKWTCNEELLVVHDLIKKTTKS